MTEAEWLSCTNPNPMLKFLRAKTSDRKLRLFACACCRRIGHLLTDKRISEKTIEFAEHFADGPGTKNELHGHAWGKPGEAFEVVQRKAWDAAEGSARYAAEAVAGAILRADQEKFKAWENAIDIAWLQQGYLLSEAIEIANAIMPAEWVEMGKSARRQEQKNQSALVGDIFGNPFRSVTFDPSWLTFHVANLAQVIYDTKAFNRMPELGDALVGAGCTDQAILEHCGQPGTHIRGCWLVDLILGKE